MSGGRRAGLPAPEDLAEDMGPPPRRDPAPKEPTKPTRASLGFWLSGVPGAGALEYMLPDDGRR